MTRRRHSRREILQATAALAAAASFGATVGRAAAAKPHAQVDAVLRRATEAREVPGVVAMAATDKGIFYEGAFGTRDLANGPEMTPDTIFRLASMTKAVTSTAAMQLVEQGRLELDQPIGNVLPELDGTKLISYREAMSLPQQPKSLVIIGAGAIGVEFAYFYNSLGTQVTLIEMLPQILPLEDSEGVEVVYRSFQKAGIKIFTNAKVEKVDKTGAGITVHGTTEKGPQVWEAEICLVAVGVQANSDNMGLEDLKVELDRGFIKTGDAYQSNVPGLYAIGDVIGAPMLAHAASHEGILAVEGMAGQKVHRLDPRTVPSCTYCQPQVASVGLTEAKVKELGLDYKIGKFPFSAIGKATAIGEREGLVKLIFEAKYGELLGAHIVGSEATEMIAELGLAQTHGGIPESIANTIHAHPTLTEAVMEAALGALGRSIHI
jgi:dihydrolipoamide dehydrogenase